LIFRKRVLSCLVFAGLLSACAGNGTRSILPQLDGAPSGGASPASAIRRAVVHFRFKIPRKPRGRAAHFLSPATKSLRVTAFNATHTMQVAQVTQNATPGASGCTGVANGTFACSVAMSVPPGNATFDVAAFDAANAAGSKLSATTDFPFAVVAGSANDIGMTLGGIPSSIAVALVGAPVFATGSMLTGFQIGGIGSGAKQQLQVTAKDADGYTIVGPGAPAFSLTSASAAVSIAAVAGVPGRFAVTPLAETNALPVPNPITSIALSAKATPAGAGTNPISASVSLQNDPIAYVANYETTDTVGSQGVQAYAPWSAAPVLSIPAGSNLETPALALDAAGNLYVSSYYGGVFVFPPAGTSPSRSILTLYAVYYGLVVDTAGDIFVAEDGTDVKEFTPSGGSFPTRTLSSTTSPSGIDTPYDMAVDSSGNLYVANYGGSIGVAVFAPGTSTTPIMTFNTGMNEPYFLTFDGAHNLYVVEHGGKNVTEYKPPFTNTTPVFQTFGSSATLSSNQNLAVDGSGNVYVADYTNNAIFEYTPAAPAAAARTFPSKSPPGVALDPLGNVYVPFEGSDSGPVDVYPPGTSTTTIDSWSTGLDLPYSIAVWP
jgi:hypothetical protein